MIYYFNTGVGNNYLDSLSMFIYVDIRVYFLAWVGRKPLASGCLACNPSTLSHTRSEEKAGM